VSEGAAQRSGAAWNPGSGQSFPKTCRLLDPAEFDAVFAARRALRSQHLNLHFAHSPQGHARLGIVVGKRQLRRAVQRNRFKRLVREAFRMRAGALPALDLVLRLAKPLARVDRRALRAEIDTLFARAASHPQ
jgi:ribonuclease P protein component